MQKKSRIQRVSLALFKRRQVMIVDANSRKAAKNWSVRPISFFLIPLLLLAIGAIFGKYHTAEETPLKVSSQDVQLRHSLGQLRNALTAVEASNDVKQAQILSLEELIKKQQANIAKSNERLRLFESILQARKNQGINILRASVKPSTSAALDFSMTLVKGGNYPRYARGKIHFITQDQHGKNIRLHFENKQTTLPFRMETHIFLQGQLYWDDDAAIPKQLGDITVIISDLKGKKIAQEKCTFGDF